MPLIVDKTQGTEPFVKRDIEKGAIYTIYDEEDVPRWEVKSFGKVRPSANGKGFYCSVMIPPEIIAKISNLIDASDHLKDVEVHLSPKAFISMESDFTSHPVKLAQFKHIFVSSSDGKASVKFISP